MPIGPSLYGTSDLYSVIFSIIHGGLYVVINGYFGLATLPQIIYFIPSTLGESCL